MSQKLSALRIKNWKSYQHYQYRKPPWIKLYRDILDDKQWHELSGDTAKGLVMLWLIASENDGYLPDSTTLAFRLRISENRAIALLSDCSHWLEGYASNVLATCEQDATPEKSRVETEKRQSREESTATPRVFSTPNFQIFWEEYPYKIDQPEAIKEWFKVPFIEKSMDKVLAGLALWKSSAEWSEERYIIAPAKFLKNRRWEAVPRRKAETKNEQVRRTTKEAIARVRERIHTPLA